MKPAVVTSLLLVALVAVAPGLASESVVPSERCRDYFMVPMAVGGDPDRVLWMLLDTGAATSIVDPDAIARIVGQATSRRRVRLRDVSAGAVEFGSVRARLRELDHLGYALGRPFDGILGYDAFHDVLLTLDYPAGEVRVAAGRLPEPDGETVFALAGPGRPFLPVAVPGDVRAMLLDSGSGSFLSLSEDAEFDWATPPIPISASALIDRIVMRSAGRLDGDVAVGRARLPRPVVELRGGTELIGTRLLRSYAWTFDQRRRRVRMLGSESDVIHSGPGRGTGAILRAGPDGFVVSRVADGTPAAEAGLRVDDVVVRVDGVPTNERGCDSKLSRETDAEVTLTVRRGDREFEAHVRSVDLIP